MAVSVLGVWIQYNAPKVQYTERIFKIVSHLYGKVPTIQNGHRLKCWSGSRGLYPAFSC